MTARDADFHEQLRRLHLVDEVMPVMLAYVDSTRHYRYHNRAFRDWIGAEAAQIDGRSMLEVLGESVYREIEGRTSRALAGQVIRYERTHRTREGGAQRLAIHLVPHHDESGAVAGLFVLIADQGHRGNVLRRAGVSAAPSVPLIADAQALYQDSIDMEFTGWRDAADRIKSALKNDEFLLYAQPIRDLNDDSRRFYEIYLRMTEEEENMMPPGAFFPLAEKYGLMCELDRWAVTNVLKAVAASRAAGGRSEAAYCVTLSADSIADPYFIDFVRAQLAVHRVPGEALRFQLSVRDVEANPGDAGQLVQHLIRLDCSSVLHGFGRDRVDFDLLKDLPIVFLRIDSGIIYRVLRDEGALATLKSINRIAHTVGINTIADLVESDELIAKLREVGVDYAHGVGIGIPVPLGEAL